MKSPIEPKKLINIAFLFAVLSVVLCLLPTSTTKRTSNNINTKGELYFAKESTEYFLDKTGYGAVGCAIISASCFISLALVKKPD
ncbi:MAG: hypothetical protein KDC92_00415 [Bacteroidetes bacterium]|nr:hypothetical protein [Bacteroidota bacterium]